ncbi:hypothetical protein ACPEIC_05720 [Stenotrophomonas sp. NPDC087984]
MTSMTVDMPRFNCRDALQVMASHHVRSIVGPLVVPRLRRHRGAAAVTLVAYVAVVGAARFLMTDDDPRDVLIRYVIIPAGITAIVTGLMFPNKRFYDVVQELEESRRHEAELPWCVSVCGSPATCTTSRATSCMW